MNGHLKVAKLCPIPRFLCRLHTLSVNVFRPHSHFDYEDETRYDTPKDWLWQGCSYTFYLVGLLGLELNKYEAVLRYKAELLQVTTNTGQIPITIIADKAESYNREIDKFGETAVKRLNQSYYKDFSDADVEQIISYYESGKTTTELAKQFGCSKGTISKLLRQHGINVTKAKAQMKLDVKTVILMYKERYTMAEIAGHFGVSTYSINRCLHSNGVKIRNRWDYQTK